VAASLALIAAIFHVFNHSLFKSLLFLGAGAVLRATGERDMERLGGLIHRMPVTAFAFLLGCIAISALPPFNGFVSEWLTFQAILLSPQLPQWIPRLLVPAIGATLACSAALAAACFVKAFGSTFLGRARAPTAGTAVETDRWSLGAMLLLAALCLAAGVMPGFVIDGPRRQRPAGGRAAAQAISRGCDRADRPRAQRLQRVPGIRNDRRRSRTDRDDRAALRIPRPAAVTGLGLRIPGRQPGDAVQLQQLRAADPPRLWQRGIPRARARHDASTR
jgi:hypothetical protein